MLPSSHPHVFETSLKRAICGHVKPKRSWTSQLKKEIIYRRRPYRVEYTGSLSTSEVKQHRARLVLGWGTAWEDLWVLSAFPSARPLRWMGLHSHSAKCLNAEAARSPSLHPSPDAVAQPPGQMSECKSCPIAVLASRGFPFSLGRACARWLTVADKRPENILRMTLGWRKGGDEVENKW